MTADDRDAPARVHVGVCVRVRVPTAEPAAGAHGMRYPVESNGTFMETDQTAAGWFTERRRPESRSSAV